MDTSEKSFDIEQLAEFSRALKDYKNTGVKQCLSILKDLLESNTTLNQLKESKLGVTLSKIAKEEFTDPEEKQIKDEAIKVFKRCKAREEKPAQGEGDKPAANGTEKEEKKPRVEERKEEKIRKEDKPSAADVFGASESDSRRPSNTSIPRREPPKEVNREPERKKESVKKDSSSSSGVSTLPYLEPQHRNFSVKSFADGLLMDYKANPAEKERLRPLANKKAVEMERVLNEKVKGNENDYRLQARDLSTFLILKSNSELRKYLLESDGDCKDFVYNKENFMNQAAREKLEKTSRRLIDAANADYDKKTVRESALYQCKNCKSRKISKTEKQTRSGDEPMTSFFQCVDCGKGWKE